jgi:benzodiazapine receptor
MTDSATATDRLRAILVLAATIGTIVFNWLAATIGTIVFNWLAAAGRIGGVTPAEISDKYPTLVTPASYAFSIWVLIYAGLIAFSIYQFLPANLARFRNIRSLFIISCALNCAWLYFWLSDQIGLCLAIIACLLFVLFLINWNLRRPGTIGEYWSVKAPFGIYFGWVTVATLINFAVFLKYLNVELSAGASTALAVALILFAAALSVIVRYRLSNYLYPLAIAWALTAIGVKQSGQTLVVTAAAFGTIACLIATLSLVVNLPSSQINESPPE